MAGANNTLAPLYFISCTIVCLCDNLVSFLLQDQDITNISGNTTLSLSVKMAEKRNSF